MLKIDVVMKEWYDEDALKFVKTTVAVSLEHSLVTVSKWESVWEKAFLGKEEKTNEQTLSYVKLMILNDDLSLEVFQKLIENHLEEVKAYIEAPMTATKVHTNPNAAQSREVVTSELIYYWMLSLNVPVQFENWHLNRLITLIQVINLKNTPKKKMSLNDRRNLNRKRLSALNARG